MAESVKISLTNYEGRHDFILSPDQISHLITELIEKSAAPQKVVFLKREIDVKANSIPVEFLAFEPDPSGDILLLIGTRALQLQFCVRADQLTDFYLRLSSAVEADPSPPE